MERIRQWVNDGGTYQDGVELFLEFSQDPGMCDLFTQENETEFKRKMLKQELLQLLKNNSQHAKPSNACQPTVSEDKDTPPVVVPGGQPVASEKVTTKSPGRWSHPSNMSPIEKKMHDAWHPLFLEMCHLQNTIYEVAKAGKTDPAKKTEAAQMAFRILDLSKQCRNFYQKRDLYFTTGQVRVDPEPVKQYAVETAAAFKEWENAKRYVRQMKKNLAKNPDDENSKRLLAIHQATVEHHDKTFKK